MSNHEYIYVAEAYNKHGERVERIAHTTREGAIEDISVQARSMDENVVTNVSPLPLYGGPEGEVTGIETWRDP